LRFRRVNEKDPREEVAAMSIHRSLVTKDSLVRSRNVLTRYERILQLRKVGRWDEETSSPYGLPKVRVMKLKKRGKEKKKKAEEESTE
jgi:small basic protein (TIGR04137 family)